MSELDTKDAASGKPEDAKPGTTVDATDEKSGANTADAKGSAKDGEDVSGLKAALAAERKSRERAEKAEKSLRDAELAKLPEIDRLNAHTKELTATNEKLTLDNVKMKIALDLELPWRIAKRITGDNEAEMREDAADLLKDYKARSDDDPKDSKRPTNDSKKSSGANTTGPSMNRLLRAAAGKGGK